MDNKNPVEDIRQVESSAQALIEEARLATRQKLADLSSEKDAELRDRIELAKTENEKHLADLAKQINQRLSTAEKRNEEQIARVKTEYGDKVAAVAERIVKKIIAWLCP